MVQIKPEGPYSARPVIVQTRISLGCPSCGATPLCLGFGKGPAWAAPFLPASGAVSSRKWPYLSLEYLTQPAQRPSSPVLAWPASQAVHHLCALDSAKVPCAGAHFLPASGAVSSQKWPLNNNFYASTDKPLAERIELAHWGQSLLCKSQL